LNTISIVSFITATAAVAVFTYVLVGRMKKSKSATEEYFTGGRALTWPMVAGSLLLTNLSTEQLVGLNGDVFGDKAMVGVAWEALAAFAMIATALVFLQHIWLAALQQLLRSWKNVLTRQPAQWFQVCFYLDM